IYRKKVGTYRPAVDFSEKTVVPPREILPPPKAPPPPDRIDLEAGLQQRVDRLILNELSPTGVVINSQMDVLQFRGKTGPYLEHQAGAASLNLLKMAREDLVLDLRRVVTKAVHTGHRAEQQAETRIHGKYQRLKIEVLPLPRTSSFNDLFLVLFTELSRREHEETSAVRDARGRKRGQPSVEHKQLERLRDELTATKDSLQAIIEEQDATNEELKSANEEIQSSNEELQSTNEELET